MKRLTMIVFVIILVIAAYEVFQPQAPFPSTDSSFVTAAASQFLGLN